MGGNGVALVDTGEKAAGTSKKTAKRSERGKETGEERESR